MCNKLYGNRMNQSSRIWMLVVILIMFSLTSNAKVITAAEDNLMKEKTVAIVIDDFGNNMQGTLQMLSMSIPITAAIMPFLPSTKSDAELAYERGHDVIVHLPLEPEVGKPEWLGPGAIFVHLSDEEIRKRTIAAINDVPHAIGMNNHMGSKATADERVMRIILTVCKERGLFYLDSKTTSKSVVAKVANELGVSYVTNNIFLDDQYTDAHIDKQMNKIHQLIKEKNQIIAIGHVGPPGKITASAIKQNIPALSRQVKFIRISDWIAMSYLMEQPMIMPNP
ncbi:divergent polysaccharide deacetylase family protein [Paenibacillus yanchengensis]|uniref:Divergent polysaccharide deacetylase family protein n=1 Tax=Paenibacillus yanchengensis TaxID=2035833 RepID=A0ABW4YKK9_9BACL